MRVDDVARVLVGVAHAALHAELVDDGEDHVLGVDAPGERAVHAHLAQLGLGHRQALRGQHVAHLGGPDAEGDGADGAVRGGVAVAARDGHARLGEAELGPDHVDDALLARRHVEQGQAEVLHVAVHVRGHVLRHRVGVGPRLIRRRDDVVERAEGPLGHPHLQLGVLQHLERLRRRHLVDEVQADQELGLAGRQRPDRVRLPHLVEQRACHVSSSCVRRRERVSCPSATM